ncbi:MAG: Gfo/Idh/MocA family oxidoreductase [Bacteroidota bacterium]
MKVLLIGLGSIGTKHVNALVKLIPAAKVQALRSSKDAAPFPGVENIYAWEEASQPDWVLISNPTFQHAEAISKALRFQCPLFIEKPVVNQVEEGAALLSEIKNSGIPTYVACNLRFLEGLRFVKDYLTNTSQQVLEVSSYCGSYLPDWRIGQDFRVGYSASISKGGGVRRDLIHEADYLYWLFGAPTNHQHVHTSASPLEIEAEDYAHYLWQYPNFTATITLNYFRKQAKRELEIVLEEEILRLDLRQNKLWVNEQEVFSAAQRIGDTYTEQLQYFFSVIEGEVKGMNDFEEAMQVLRLALPS